MVSIALTLFSGRGLEEEMHVPLVISAHSIKKGARMGTGAADLLERREHGEARPARWLCDGPLVRGRSAEDATA